MIGLSHVILYVRDAEAVSAFYCRLFGYTALTREGDRIVELTPSGQGARILLHPAAKSQRQGQSQAKLAFHVPDVAAFCAATDGVSFGPIQDGGGYQFANSKDPSGNSVQVTSRPL